MASFTVDDASVEDKLLVLSQWWTRHNRSFSTWYLSLTTPEQQLLILKCIPDIPLSSCTTSELPQPPKIPDTDSNIVPPGSSLAHSVAPSVKPTDIILPELNLDGLLASSGRIFVLFITRRLTSKDLLFHDDILFLNALFAEQKLPSFSNNSLESMDTPFIGTKITAIVCCNISLSKLMLIDPIDPEENLRSLSNLTPEATRKQIDDHLNTGDLSATIFFISLTTFKVTYIL